MQLRHDPTFFWATGRLPAAVRPAVHAVYGFVRYADELVDGPRRPPTPALRRAALDGWERALDRARAGDAAAAPAPVPPVIRALVDAERRHGLPLAELHVYMDSMRVDCGRVRISSADELARYMDGSAAAVGRVLAPLLGCDAPDDMARIGVAFQLTNFIRDVREDWALDRVYLPGLPEADLARGRSGEEARARVAEQVSAARALFAATADVPERCDRAVRSGMRLARAVYGRVLDRCETLGYDVLGGRTALRPWQLAAAAAGGLRG